MGTKSLPDTDRGRATVRSIVGTASDLFYRQGVHATGLNQIAEVSGTGKGQIYHYFKDKDDLILSVIEEQINRALNGEREYISTMKTLADLRAWAEHLVDQYEQSDGPIRCPMGSLVIELADENPTFRQALDQGFMLWRAGIVYGLKNIIELGELPPDADAEMMAEVLLSAYEGGVLLSEVHGNTKSLRLAMRASVEWIIMSQEGRTGKL